MGTALSLDQELVRQDALSFIQIMRRGEPFYTLRAVWFDNQEFPRTIRFRLCFAAHERALAMKEPHIQLCSLATLSARSTSRKWQVRRHPRGDLWSGSALKDTVPGSL